MNARQWVWTLGVCVAVPIAAGCESQKGSSSANSTPDAKKGEPTATAAASPAVSGSVSPPAATAPEEPQPQRPYNVLLLMIDSLRADMPWAGYPRDVAPWMTAFQKEHCTSYPRAYAISSYTAKSVAPALVGRYGSEMARDGKFFTIWYDDNLFVSERAQKQGHRTLAGHGHGYFMKALGLDQGFDDYQLLPGTFLDVTGVHDVTSEKLNALAKKMLSDPANVALADGKRFFAYFHFLDPHYTYYRHDDHPDFGSGRRDLYDNEVHYTDEWVGDLVDWARSQPWGKETVVIITADHGEGFGEHNHYRHAYELWEALVRVPLFVCVPGAKPRRIEEPRGHIDLAPTIADLMGLETSPPFRGVSLVPEVFGASAESRPVLIDLPRADLMDRRRGVISGDYKLLSFGDDASWQLYDVSKDFEEKNDLSKEQPEKLAEMKALYEKLWAEVPNEKVRGNAALKGAPPGRRW